MHTQSPLPGVSQCITQLLLTPAELFHPKAAVSLVKAWPITPLKFLQDFLAECLCCSTDYKGDLLQYIFACACKKWDRSFQNEWKASYSLHVEFSYGSVVYVYSVIPCWLNFVWINCQKKKLARLACQPYLANLTGCSVHYLWLSRGEFRWSGQRCWWEKRVRLSDKGL